MKQQRSRSRNQPGLTLSPEKVLDITRERTSPLNARTTTLLATSQSGSLPQEAREPLENAFAHDFSKIRVHADSVAERLCVEANATALSIANHIIVAPTHFRPATPEGIALLAHELTHIVHATGSDRVYKQTTSDKVASPLAPEASGESTAAPVGRLIKLSGGQQAFVYGTYSAEVEAALADGWLSFLEMEKLWSSVKSHQMSDNAGHDVMEMLAQRSLKAPDDAGEISSLKTSEERLTWKSVANLGSLTVPGAINVSPGEHYMAWDVPLFETVIPDSQKKVKRDAALVETERKSKHEFNMRLALARIDSADWLAPDDKVVLRRLQFLHYVMRYPSEQTPGERLNLPEPTPAQQARYRNLRHAQPRQLTKANELSVELNLPDML